MFETVTHTGRREMLRLVRDRLVERARRRSTGTFTSDDVHTLLKHRKYNGDFQSVISTVLNESNFCSTGGTVPSARPTARGRQINVWTTYENMFAI